MDLGSVHNRNLRGLPNPHQNQLMPYRVAGAMLVFCFGTALCLCSGQPLAPNHDRGGNPKGKKSRALTEDDGLAVISAALDSKVRHHASHDCSHLVHAVYERAGFPYAYASSDDLYDGVEGFLRVSHPQPGDLIVWHGHVGIVVRPSRHVFFSFLTAGPGIDDYASPYWVHRGQPRFYRYIKNDRCPGCAMVSASGGRRPN
ncbi:MAG TPA: CHAP domain-containing protein [Candidatus Sulfotelmatobacter sp.]|nr:CHAP domain-containing protein [Candidatus Sulfotelmatobacter sp.]